MKLEELQASFQAALLSGGDPAKAAVIDHLNDSMREHRATLLSVYVDAYRIRLAEFIADDYPCLRQLLGEEDFDALCEAYIVAEPSRFRSARHFSSRLPEFMDTNEAWRSDTRAISLARVERALSDSFDAPDATIMTIEALGAVAPERWPALSFVFDPSLYLLDVAPGVVAALEAANADQPIGPAEGEGARLAVWRCEGESVWRALEEDEYIALNEARTGQSFGAICQMVAFQNENDPAPQRLAQFLTSWFSNGLIVGLRDS
jgi:hypothetical protein